MKNKLVVISFDAMVQEDLEEARKYPTFRWLLENGAMVRRMRSIYPTLTYPCHVAMATGCYPDRAGVTANERFLPGVSPLPWQFYHDAVKVPDILDACKAAGYTTASVGWPVTGRHPGVDYLVDEIWPDGALGDWDAFARAYMESGTPKALFDEVVAPHMWMRLSRRQPESSLFLARVSGDLIRKHRPDILLLHVGNMDHYRHVGGVFCPRVTAGVSECEAILAELVNAAKDAGVFEQTNFVATADHGQMDAARTVRPNVLFRRHGLIRTDGAGNVTDWQAWSFSAGFSAQIKLKDPGDAALRDRVYSLLKGLRDEGVWGFSEVYTVEETRAMEHLAGDFSFVLETDNFSKFGNDWNGPYAVNAPQSLSGPRAGSHGYHPDKGPNPIFVGCGPAFRKGAVLEKARLVDGAPTYARIMGAQLPTADGRAMEELLNA